MSAADDPEQRASASGSGTFCAMPAGDRKMPEPIVMPMTSATELQRPSVRGKRSVGRGHGGDSYAMADAMARCASVTAVSIAI